jgi:hypothetical protein
MSQAPPWALRGACNCTQRRAGKAATRGRWPATLPVATLAIQQVLAWKLGLHQLAVTVTVTVSRLESAGHKYPNFRFRIPT